MDVVEREESRAESEFEVVASDQQEFVPFALRTLPQTLTATVMNESSGASPKPNVSKSEEQKEEPMVVRPPARQRIGMPLIFGDRVCFS